MDNENLYEFNNADSVLKQIEEKGLEMKNQTRLVLNESGIGEVQINDENIKNNSKFIVELFDEN